MCGRFVQYSNSICAAPPRYNVAPTQVVLAIRESDEGKRELVPLRRGLVPSWSKGPDSRYSMINARAETVHSKPAYRTAFKRRRCLIPAEGFYEWKAEKRGKAPVLIRRKDSEPFAMAGLWERWRHEGEAALESCTIIVTDANELVRPIHDRMPVILAPENYAAWLDPANKDADGLAEMLKPTSQRQWTMHPVSGQVNSPRNDGPELFEPLAAEQA